MHLIVSAKRENFFGRHLRLLALTTLLLALQTVPASAHGDLISSSPQSDSTVVALPASVVLEFDGDLIDLGKGENSITVEDSAGVQIDNKDSKVAGRKLEVTLSKTTPVGKFHVTFRIVSEDGHPVTGEYYFQVTNPTTAIPDAIPSVTTSETMSPQEMLEMPSDSKNFWSTYGNIAIFLSLGTISVLIWYRATRKRKETEGGE
ncbi:MAG: hypothetical protein F2704_02165 [Actinobacteria bacterium]|uniref:Unannotated protein n=1 Tax=freshwater metagenome TaxID=449393 RepID=A0A6J7H8H7_9ZZZZ|nr:copper resistance protein CopC [Actinomycetota bacterium]MSW46898.1 hypothetical protein [Actinomycetota bacterium]MSX24420.1 hypothetical protein [Actinomycetota bacterium]MSY46025.1 hypothetical protein [Actinomycetota bacterium]MSY57058.1 hypothetical protein [Actinomycetota bacterium]